MFGAGHSSCDICDGAWQKCRYYTVALQPLHVCNSTKKDKLSMYHLAALMWLKLIELARNTINVGMWKLALILKQE